VLDHGLQVATEEGTPQGAVISPLLANIYLHYICDLWVQAGRRRQATGDMIVVERRARGEGRPETFDFLGSPISAV